MRGNNSSASKAGELKPIAEMSSSTRWQKRVSASVTWLDQPRLSGSSSERWKRIIPGRDIEQYALERAIQSG